MLFLRADAPPAAKQFKPSGARRLPFGSAGVPPAAVFFPEDAAKMAALPRWRVAFR